MRNIIAILSVIYCLSINAVEYTQDGNNFTVVKSKKTRNSYIDTMATGKTLTDAKGIKRDIYLSKNKKTNKSRAYVLKTNKEGKVYRSYLDFTIVSKL